MAALGGIRAAAAGTLLRPRPGAQLLFVHHDSIVHLGDQPASCHEIRHSYQLTDPLDLTPEEQDHWNSFKVAPLRMDLRWVALDGAPFVLRNCIVAGRRVLLDGTVNAASREITVIWYPAGDVAPQTLPPRWMQALYRPLDTLTGTRP
ncbi:hypothetical protein [Streptacidiphilus cavernicola]|uniref:Uncharacterized protein n=1 Tax=Streptacidiphilus cavernicola TaxID=3342716 RepID=A0ABV6VY24_9ACTN